MVASKESTLDGNEVAETIQYGGEAEPTLIDKLDEWWQRDKGWDSFASYREAKVERQGCNNEGEKEIIDLDTS